MLYLPYLYLIPLVCSICHPTTVKNMPQRSPLSLSPFILNLCPLVLDTPILGQRLPFHLIYVSVILFLRSLQGHPSISFASNKKSFFF